LLDDTRSFVNIRLHTVQCNSIFGTVSIYFLQITLSQREIALTHNARTLILTLTQTRNLTENCENG
jgi:hypothetical protein